MQSEFLNLHLFLLILHILYVYNFNSKLIFFSSIIKLTIKGTGNKKIFSRRGTSNFCSQKFKYPDQIIINRQNQKNIKDSYALSQNINNIKLIWNDNLINACGMFFKSDACQIDLSEFNSSKITQMHSMFSGCGSLTSINFGNFDTSKVNEMKYLFRNCESLISLNLSSFDSSQVNDFEYMFDGCSNLKYIDMRNFEILNKAKTNNMFTNTNKQLTICTNDETIKYLRKYENIIECIVEVDKEKESTIIAIISTYDFKDDDISTTIHESEQSYKYENEIIETSEINEYLSYTNNNDLIEITEIEIDNSLSDLYEYCTEREETDFNIYENELIETQVMDKKEYDETDFNEYENELIETQEIDKAEYNETDFNIYEYKLIETQEGDKAEYDETDKESIRITETDIEESDKKYIEFTEKIETDKAISDKNYNENVEQDESYKFNSITIEECNLIQCFSCSNESLIQGLCISCNENENYYPIEDSLSNQSLFINCTKDPKGYYLDNDSSSYKKCYKSCESCELKGDEDNHNCLQCKNEFIYEEIYSNYMNCYSICPDNNTKCHILPKCDKIKKKLIPEKNICVSNCNEDPVYIFEFNNSCFNKCPNDTKESKIKKNYCELECPKDLPYENIITKECILNCSINDMFNNICRENYKEINTTLNENLSSRIITEILNGNLDTLLNKILEKNNDIIIEEDFTIHQITSLNNQNTKLNMSSINFGKCEDLIRKEYNISDNEELIIYKIENSVDGFNIPIIEYALFTKDGRNRLNLTICNNLTIQYNIPVSINEDEIYKYDPSSEFYTDECYKYSTNDNLDMTLFERKNEFNNNNMSLCESNCNFKGYNKSNSKAICDCNIKNDLSYSYNDNNNNDLLIKIANDKSNSNLGLTQCLDAFTSPEQIKSNSGFFLLLCILIIFVIIFIIFCVKGKNLLENKIDEIIYDKFENNKKKIKQKIFGLNNKNNLNKKLYRKSIRNSRLSVKLKNCFSIKMGTNELLNENSNIKNYKIFPFEYKDETVNTKIATNNDNIPDIKNDYELNNLTYLEALKYDKRSCCEYYCSLIKNKQIITFTFCSFNDYNSGVIKKFIFFLSFALHYTINAFFFTDSNMHQIYEDKGKFNFSYQLRFIIVSAISSTVILRIMLITLVLTDKSILKVKKQNTKESAIKMKIKVLKCVNIKYVIFFVLNLILLIFFWIYLTCFNGKYENTQIYLIENTFISFGFSLLYPFIINIIPSFLRAYSLDGNKNDRKYIYTFSKVLQLL